MEAAEREPDITTADFEAIEHATEQATESVRLEYIGGRMKARAAHDGDHNRILNWLLMLLLTASPELFLHRDQGLKVEKYRNGRARPDGVVAPLDAFVGCGEWATPAEVVMAVEVTSHDSDSTRRDRMEKPIAYAQAGIPIYLLIDRDSTEVVVHSNPDGGAYQQVCRYAFGLPVVLPDPMDITIDTTPLRNWAD